MKIIIALYTFIHRSLTLFADWLMHCTVFHRQLTFGAVEFFGPDEIVELDGYLVVRDLYFDRLSIYGYRFDNRYMMRMSPQKRCATVWRAAMMHDGRRPLVVIEGDRALTPYGSYDTVPPTYARVLRDALTPQSV